MPSATFAESRLSRAAKRATAIAADRSAPHCVALTGGSVGSGSAPGNGPMSATGSPSSETVAVAAMTPRSEAGSRGSQWGTRIITAATRTVTARAGSESGEARRSASSAVTRTPPGSGTVTPSAVGTCCRKMMTAMPTVKPSMTGQGR